MGWELPRTRASIRGAVFTCLPAAIFATRSLSCSIGQMATPVVLAATSRPRPHSRCSCSTHDSHFRRHGSLLGLDYRKRVTSRSLSSGCFSERWLVPRPLQSYNAQFSSWISKGSWLKKNVVQLIAWHCRFPYPQVWTLTRPPLTPICAWLFSILMSLSTSIESLFRHPSGSSWCGACNALVARLGWWRNHLFVRSLPKEQS